LNKFRPFEEVVISNSEVGSNEKLADSEDLENDSKKGPIKTSQVSVPSLFHNLY
jgi:hypothetical protein